jgi:integrase/recombinase XerC
MTEVSSRTNTDLEIARALLAKLGVSPRQLLEPTTNSIPTPTFADYIERVSAAVTTGTRRSYQPYWSKVRNAWGDRRLSDVSPLDVKQLVEQCRNMTVVRRNARGGRGAEENLIAALRCLYRHAVIDGIINESENPAAKVAKPARYDSLRHALAHHQLQDLIEVAGSGGNDPELDLLIIRFHIETACRRGGALTLARTDIDSENCTARLHEKGNTVRLQPISPTLRDALVAHHTERSAGMPDAPVLRYRDGTPLTGRRYDSLWQRLRASLPWAAALQVSAHWLRHTTLTWVERNFGIATARAFAGHNRRSRQTSVTFTYVKADIHEVARALEQLTGERHPLTVDQ